MVGAVGGTCGSIGCTGPPGRPGAPGDIGALVGSALFKPDATFVGLAPRRRRPAGMPVIGADGMADIGGAPIGGGAPNPPHLRATAEIRCHGRCAAGADSSRWAAGDWHGAGWGAGHATGWGAGQATCWRAGADWHGAGWGAGHATCLWAGSSSARRCRRSATRQTLSGGLVQYPWTWSSMAFSSGCRFTSMPLSRVNPKND